MFVYLLFFTDAERKSEFKDLGLCLRLEGDSSKFCLERVLRDEINSHLAFPSFPPLVRATFSNPDS